MSTPLTSPTAKVLPLHNGDHLDREEFERRYRVMPNLKKAELIEGVVYMPSPVSFESHGEQHFNLITWLGIYRGHTPGVRGGDNSTVRLDLDNEPQPDVLLIVDPVCGGVVTIEEGYITGGPELVAEVAASSVSIDRNAKLRAYQRNGVREYLLWRVEESALDWFVLRGEVYEPLLAGPDHIVRSVMFPGLWLNVPALITGDLPSVFLTLQQGITSPEHSAFIERLRYFKETT